MKANNDKKFALLVMFGVGFFLMHPLHCLAFQQCNGGAPTSNNISQYMQTSLHEHHSHRHHTSHEQICGNIISEQKDWTDFLLPGDLPLLSVESFPDKISRSLTPVLHRNERIIHARTASVHLLLNIFLC